MCSSPAQNCMNFIKFILVSEAFPVRALIVLDSIAKYVTDIRSTEVIPYPGITINGRTSVIQSGELVLDKQFTTFHDGTNDTPHFDVGTILSC